MTAETGRQHFQHELAELEEDDLARVVDAVLRGEADAEDAAAGGSLVGEKVSLAQAL